MKPSQNGFIIVGRPLLEPDHQLAEHPEYFVWLLRMEAAKAFRPRQTATKRGAIIEEQPGELVAAYSYWNGTHPYPRATVRARACSR